MALGGRLRGALGVLLIGCVALVAPLSGAADETRESRVRAASKAGNWYPDDPAELHGYLERLLAPPAATPALPVRALVVPHAGYVYSAATAARAYRLVQGRHFRRVVVIGPAHHVEFHGLSIMDVDAYRTPLGEVPLDHQAISRLRSSPLVSAVERAHSHEHAIELQLPFLQTALSGDWQLVPILVGRMDAGDYESAAALLEPLLDSGTLVVVSGDFTHYGSDYDYHPFPLDDRTPERIRALDRGIVELAGDIDPPGLARYRARMQLNDCVHGPLMLLLHTLPGDSRVEVIGYATSGAITGSYRNSVSYVALTVSHPLPLGGTLPPSTDPLLDRSDLRYLHRLAVMAVIAATTRTADDFMHLQALLEQSPGRLRIPLSSFVTLKRGKELRGCIGTIRADAPLAESVVRNAISAALYDERFPPVRHREVAGLSVEVSVLSSPEAIASPADLEIGRHGVILEKDRRKAVYLPKVALEQGWDRQEMLRQLSLKAGLDPDAWQQGARLWAFTTLTYDSPASPRVITVD